jgi:2-oxoglutarate ferredoxin oxidoreductase subunit beta
MATMAELTTKEQPTWCGGCGDFGILTGVKQAFAQLNLPREQTVLVSGIGCGSKLPHFVKTYGFEGLHGRALAVATGVKLANPELNVVAVTGDGDGYGIGGNHFLHTLRRNLDMCWIIENNEVYGLTKGQTSPTSKKGFKTPSTPQGAIETPINPVALGIVGGATFVARCYSFDIQHLVKTIAAGIQHKGFAMIDVMQYCPTYNKVNTLDWFRTGLAKIPDTHDTHDANKALEIAINGIDGKMPYGVFYVEERPTYEECLPAEVAPAKADLTKINAEPLIARYK